MDDPFASSPHRALQEARAILERGEPDSAKRAVALIDQALAAYGSGPTEPTTGTRPRAPVGDERAEAELLDVVCHDLKDPLAAVMMGAAFLLKALPDDTANARARKMTVAMQRSAERVNGLVKNLLDYTKIERDRLNVARASHELGPMVDEAARRVAPAASSRGVKIVLDVAEPARAVDVDAPRLEDALAHLMTNAVRHSPQGGQIEVSARVDGGALRLEVRDHGDGIAEDRQLHLFDARWHMRQVPREGTGLGLAIADGVARAHGGEVRLEQTGATGSAFVISVPIA